MATFRRVLEQGVRSALRHWSLLLPLYLAGLLLGLLQTWPLLSAGVALDNPFMRNLAAGGVEPIFELWMANPAIAQSAALWILAALLLSLLYGLVYNFFAGGILAVLATDDARASVPSFWAGCWRWFGSFTGLGILLVIIGLLAAVVGAIAGGLAGGYGAAIGALAGLQLINALGEYARALAVAHDRRNPFALIGMALSFVLRHLGGVLALALLGLALHAGLTALYVLGARALGGSPVLVVWQQVAVVGWLWVKLVRLAWAIRYARVARSGQPSALAPDMNPTPSL
jgi:hypothetical protein